MGVALVVLAAFAFGTSGPFGRALIEAGWSPGAAVLVRSTGSAAVLAVVVLVLRREQLGPVLRAPRTVLTYGVVAVAGVQVCYFTAVQTLSVAVALLLEYLAPVLVLGWLWLRNGQRPAGRTLVGAAIALGGTVVVLDVSGGVGLDPVGVAWALGAAVCLACYFVVLGQDGRPGGPSEQLDPMVLAGAGLLVGAVVVVGAVALGVLPATVGAATSTLAGRPVPIWLPAVALVLLSTVVAYLAGSAGTARTGAGTGSLVSLTEVLFAVLTAWLLLGQRPTPTQLLGGALVVSGLVLTQTGRRTRPAVAHRG